MSKDEKLPEIRLLTGEECYVVGFNRAVDAVNLLDSTPPDFYSNSLHYQQMIWVHCNQSGTMPVMDPNSIQAHEWTHGVKDAMAIAVRERYSLIYNLVRKRPPRRPMRQFSKSESDMWKDRLTKASTEALKPITLFGVDGGDTPMPFEVGRVSGKVTMHFFRRPGVSEEAGQRIVVAALTEVFGAPTQETMKENQMFYRDEEAIRQQEGLPRKLYETDSWFVELPTALSSILPPADNLKLKLLAAIKTAWAKEKM